MKKLTKIIFCFLLTELITINFLLVEYVYSQSIDCGLISANVQSYSGPFRGLFKPIRSDISGDSPSPSEAYFPVLIVFVQFKYDIDYPDWWPMGQPPIYIDSMISPIKRTNSVWWNAYDEKKESVSDYWMEISQGKFHVCGHAYSVVLDSTSAYYQSLGAIYAEQVINAEIWRKLNAPEIGINWSLYDKWKDSLVNGELKFFYQSDNKVDFIYKVHKSTGGILYDKDGYSSLVWQPENQGINIEVDTVNHISIEYSYSAKGSGATLCRNAEKKRIILPATHEHGHFLYANGHITYGKVAYGPGTEANFSPYEQILLGYAKYETANLANQNTFTIGDYSGRDSTQNQFLIVPINSTESFAIANRGNLSRWDRVMLGDTARILLTDLNSEYGKGAYIYHFNKQPVLPSGNENVQDLECADGFWHWSYVGTGHYYAYDRGWCWDGGSNWSVYKKDSVCYDNDSGWYSSGNLLGDDKSFFTPIRFSVGQANQDPCQIGLDRVYTNSQDYFPFDPNWGDRWDPWNRGYNEVFSPYSCPNTKTFSNSNSDIFIYLTENDSVNKTKTFHIYKVGQNGYTQDSILKITPPSRPMGLKLDYTECMDSRVFPVLTWNHNMEPDMIIPGGSPFDYKRYKIFRAYDAINNVPGNFTEIADINCRADITPTYTDYNAYLTCSGIGMNNYRIRYKIKAVDNTIWASVYSDFVATPAYLVQRVKNPIPGNNLPNEYNLSQNYPNPFNPITKINYDLPKDSKVSLLIYDILGREIVKLVNNEFKTAGRYIVDFNGINLASGVYFYKIRAGEFVSVKRMVLIK